MKRKVRNIGQLDLEDVDIKDKVLARVLGDLYDNINTQKNANLPGMALKVMVPHVDEHGNELHGVGSRAKLIAENLDGSLHVRYLDDQADADVAVEDVEAAMLRQVRLPMDIVERIMAADVESMTTKTRFYMINRGSAGESKPALLDQVSLLLALKTLAPTLHMKVAMALSINILKRYGHNADLDGDGVISPREWEALEKVLQDQESQNVRSPLNQSSQSRFVSMMLA